MKKYIISLSILSLICGCAKYDIPAGAATDYPQLGEYQQVVIAFEAETPEVETRFFEDDPTAENIEKEINTLQVLVYSANKLVYHRSLNRNEARENRVVISLPRSLFGKSCQFYLVANETLTPEQITSPPLGLMSGVKANSYNAPGGQNLYICMRQGGFTMTGSTSATISGDGVMQLSIPLKRLAAKIAVWVNVDPGYHNQSENGYLFIEDITLCNLCNTSYLYRASNPNPVYQDRYTSRPTLYNDSFWFLFYTYERPAESNISKRPYLKIRTQLYQDYQGNIKLPYSREYTVYLDLSGNGLAQRNGYYRIEVNLGNNNYSMDYEMLVTQSERSAGEI